nr:MAG TPA: holin [Caudoviricetes sp.]
MNIDVTTYVTMVLTIVGVLVVLVNIITEVLKKVLWDKLPTNILAVCVSMVLTMIAFFAWTTITGTPVLWYYVVGAVVLGFLVAYAAMFGFDKLKEVLEKLKG